MHKSILFGPQKQFQGIKRLTPAVQWNFLKGQLKQDRVRACDTQSLFCVRARASFLSMPSNHDATQSVLVLVGV